MEIIDFKQGKVIQFINPVTCDWDNIDLTTVSNEDLVATYVNCDDGLYNHFEDSIEWEYFNDVMEYIKPEYIKRGIKRRNDKEAFAVIFYID
jgi:hypothetical protein